MRNYQQIWENHYGSIPLDNMTKGMVMAKLISTGDTIQLTKADFYDGKLSGLITGVTANAILSQEHKDKVSASLKGARGIVNKVTGKRSYALCVRSKPNQILVSEIKENSEWRFIKPI